MELNLLSCPLDGGAMKTHTDQRKTKRQVLDIPSAAYQAGFSSRQFRKIIEEDEIPVLRIGTKLFIIARDFEHWKATRGETRFDQALQQIDGWIKQSMQRSAVFDQQPDMDD